MKKKKTKVKGMTLVECIIALLVFGVSAVIMVQVVTVSMNLITNANHLNNKTAAQSTAAAVRDTSGLTDNQNVTITVKSAGGTTYGSVPVKRYSTKELADPATSSQYKTNSDINLYFYDIQRTTEAP